MNIAKKYTNIIIIIFFIFLSNCILFKNGDEYNGDIENIPSALWEEDIDYFILKLHSIHPNLFFNISPDEITRQINSLKLELSYLNSYQVIVKLMNILYQIGDAHTNISFKDIPGLHFFPIKFYWMNDGLFVISANEKNKDVIGKKLVKIENQLIESIYEQIKTIIPHENEYWVKAKSPDLFRIGRILQSLGIISSFKEAEFTFQDINGNEDIRKIEAAEEDTESLVLYDQYLGIPLPLSEKYIYKNNFKNYWYHHFKTYNTLYFQYNRCRDMDEISFEDFAAEMFHYIAQNNIERIIIDLRYNTGGSSSLFSNSFIPRIKESHLNEFGKIFSIIGRKTFSSGVWAVSSLLKETNAIIYGEPTGNKPNHYGDTPFFGLPHTGIIINCSTKYWQLSDLNNDAYYPDYEIQVSSNEFFSGIDPVLESIFNKMDSEN